MRRLLPFLVFFTVVCGLLTAIHYYLWVRLVRDLALPPAVESAFAVLFAVLLVSIPLTLVFGRSLPEALGRILLRPAFTWIGLMWVLLVAVGAVDLVKVLVQGVGVLGGSEVAHASMLTHSYPVMAVALGLGAGAFALSHGFRLRVKRVEVPLEKLPKELDGTTIVQLSDVHVGPSIGRAFIERVVRTVNELNPDVVVITGDLVDGSVEKLAHAVAPLAELKARYGTYFVTGNHEYYSGAPAWCSHLSSLGVRVLRNERVEIGEPGQGFDLVGIDDHSAKGFGHGHGADLDRALEGRDATRAAVLLAHQPRAIAEAAKHGVDLQLSGHTHGGQIWPFHFLVRLQQPAVSGLERFGRTFLYVSNGTGYWGPPMRLAAPAEVTQLVLRAVSS